MQSATGDYDAPFQNFTIPSYFLTMTTKGGTGDRIISLPRNDFFSHDLARPVETPPMDDPNIPEQELWPPKKASRIHQAWAAMKTALEGNTGLLLVAASQAFFSLMNVSVKTLNSIDPPVSALQLIFVRMSITWFCCTGYMIAAKVPNPILGPKGVRLLLVFRGFTGFISLFGIYYSLQYLSLSDATVLTFLAPLCTAVAGAVLLGEKFSLKQAAAAVISLIGVVLIARPASLFGGLDEGSPLEVLLPEVDGILTAKQFVDAPPSQRMLAICVALIGVLGATGAYTTLTAIGKRAHPLHALTSFSVQSVIATSVAMLVTKQPIVIPARAEWLAMFVMIGIFGFFAQILLTMGLQRESASRGSMAIYTQIVFATIFERVFFNVVPTILSGIGTLLIVASAIYVALSKQTGGPTSSSTETTVRLRRASEDSTIEQGLLEDNGRGDVFRDAHSEVGKGEFSHSGDGNGDDQDII